MVFIERVAVIKIKRNNYLSEHFFRKMGTFFQKKFRWGGGGRVAPYDYASVTCNLFRENLAGGIQLIQDPEINGSPHCLNATHHDILILNQVEIDFFYLCVLSILPFGYLIHDFYFYLL